MLNLFTTPLSNSQVLGDAGAKNLVTFDGIASAVEWVPLGCLSCRGDAGAQTTIAANFAVLFMLFVLVFILGSLLYFMFYLARRAKMIAAEDEAIASTESNSRLSGPPLSR